MQKLFPCALLWPLALALFCSVTEAAEEAPPDSTQEADAPSDLLTRVNAKAATDQTVEVVRWLAQRRQLRLNGVDYGFTGLPFLYYSPNTGWNYGARVQWADYSRRPYRYKFTLHLHRSIEGKHNFYLRLKVPHISETGFGLQLRLSLQRDLRTRYYGLGNLSDLNRNYVDPTHDDFKDENFYFYTLDRPRLLFTLIRDIVGPLSMTTNFGLERSDVSNRGTTAFYLEEGTPDGVKDGVTGLLGISLVWDTRDDETIPRAGTFHEWSYETSRNSILGLFFEEIDFRRYTFTDAHYYPLSQRLNLAHRMVFEVLEGTIPLYAFGEIGGSRRVKGLGGNDNLRGFDTQRFTDNIRFFSNTELRYFLSSMRLYKQYLEWHGVLFADTGRVWPSLGLVEPTNVHLTGGAGFRLYWNSDFVIRLDFGRSSEQSNLRIKLRNIF